ncbi:NADPH:quinone reductase [Alkalihalophilus lindianensis]|uniref:NADPH:quinone reductase n=1 Tax=Alkalihalophilus lindianensis TaxID=1630542 RepID=A0ABU3XDB7_9BACI|nr:NADPH:quinone reductase [Alkalihalophilus lindianensis]MDV2685883.1 NADPH:quinone reductase [Alkalihalophilus lindianensis]
MRAIQYKEYGDPSVLYLGETDKPTLKKGEVLVKVGASGVNPVDTYFRKGIREVPSFPHIPHFDLAGEVVELGENVTNLAVGDRIWATNAKGASAELVAVEGAKAFPLPAHLSYEEGAAVAMAFMTAHLSLFYRAALKKEEKVLIYGAAGAVGQAAVQLAKQAGAFVIATAGNEDKAAIAIKAGADVVVNYHEENVLKRVQELTDGNGIDVILDMSVSENLDDNLDMIGNGGRIVTIGSPVNNQPTLPWRKLNMKNASLLGILLFTVNSSELVKAGKEISEGLESKALSAHVGEVFSLEEATKAHETIEAKKVDGRIIIKH